MQFIQVKDAAPGAEALAALLRKELEKGRPVLWLLAGGSNTSVEVKVMQSLPEATSKNLTIMLADERFGPVGHKDSNLQQLLDAGFAPKNGAIVPVLIPGLSLQETAEHYESTIQKTLQNASAVIAQLGMGADGHTAGILPNSESTTASSLVTAYETPEYKRITLTFNALRQVKAAYVFAFGAEKRQALENLRDKKLSLAEQPAQILAEIPEAYIYNDSIGEER